MKQTAKRPQLFYFLIITVVMSVLVCSVSFTSSAKEIIFDDYGAYQEYLYYDFNPGDIVSYEPYIDEYGNVWDNSPALHSSSEPLYPSFDINNINLDSIPQDVKDIIYSDNCGILIRVWGSSYRIHVTRDCNFFYQFTVNSSGAITRNHPVVGIATTNYGYEGFDPVCYFASYDFDGNLVADWSQAEPLDFTSQYQNAGLGSAMKIYIYPFPADSDLYYCGNWSNMKGTVGTSGRSMSVGGSGSTSTITYGTQFLSRPNSTADIYISSDLSFPSYESQELETSKSILDRIKELPETLSNFFTTLKNYLLYFSSEPVERTESAFSNLLDSVVNNLQKYIYEIDNYVNNELPSTRDNVVEYIEVGTMVIDDLLSGVPIISYVLLFAIAIIFVKKAVGK